MLGAQWNKSPMPCPQYDRTTWHLCRGEVEQHHDHTLVSYPMCNTPPCRHSEMTCGMIPTVITAQHVHVHVSSATPPFASACLVHGTPLQAITQSRDPCSACVSDVP